MSGLKKLYGSKRAAKKAEYVIRKMNQWIRWYNSHLDWNQSLINEVTYGIN